MTRPASINLKDLAGELEKSVGQLHGVEGPQFTFVHNPGIVGFVAPSAQFEGKTLSEVSAIASGISAKAGPLAGSPNIVFGNGHVTIGFVLNELITRG